MKGVPYSLGLVTKPHELMWSQGAIRLKAHSSWCLEPPSLLPYPLGYTLSSGEATSGMKLTRRVQ